ncbi:MAG: hypothetical protein ABJA82_02030 [Myxococcales bacterium]
MSGIAPVSDFVPEDGAEEVFGSDISAGSKRWTGGGVAGGGEGAVAEGAADGAARVAGGASPPAD